MSNKVIKDTVRIIGNILLCAFLAFCILTLIFTLTARRDPDGTVNLFGRQMRIVLTNSMAECEETDVSAFDIGSIPRGSVVFIRTVPEDKEARDAWYGSLREGDVLTFKYVYAAQLTITHRITEIKENDDGTGYIIRLEGDNKNTEDGALVQEIDTSKRATSFNYVIGKVTGQSYLLGLLLTLFKSPFGLILIIVASILIIGFEVFKLVRMATADKREREDKEKEEKDNELEELRRRLAELESSKSLENSAPEATAEESVAEDSPPAEE